MNSNDNKLLVKCPNCSQRLNINMVPGLANKKLTCPQCKESSPFSSFIILRKSPAPAASQRGAQMPDDAGRTQLATNNVNHEDGSRTVIATSGGHVGRLVAVAGNLAPMQLKEGRNILGRENSSAALDIALPAQYRYVSRQHLIIDVKRTIVGYTHTVMLCKSEVNKTYINSMQLVYGDQVILNDGDIVKLPDLSLRFDYK